MSLASLISEGVSLMARGTLQALARKGRSIATSATRDLVARTLRSRLNVTGGRDWYHVERFVNEQAEALAHGAYLRGETGPRTTSIVPTTTDFPPGIPSDHRYVVIVKTVDPGTGARLDIPFEVFSVGPLTGQDIEQRARDMMERREVSQRYRARVRQTANPQIVDVVIITGERRK